MSVVATVSLAPLFSEKVRHDPYAFYAELHRHGTVCRTEPGDPYAFVALGFDACSQALKHPQLRVMDEDLAVNKPSWEDSRTRAVFFNSMMFSNSPRQPRMRHVFAHTFTPRRIERLEPSIVLICRELLDHMAEKAKTQGELDLMTEYSFPMPAAVLGRLLGVPDDDLSWYRTRAAALSKVIELGGGTQENMREADKASIELTDYFGRLARERRAQPRDDLITALVQNDGLSERELLSNLVVLFNAGFVTTVHLLGNGLMLLSDNPEAFAYLRGHPESAPGYVDEFLRLEGPTHFVIRYAATDVELDGVPIPKGGSVLCLLAAANRDPRRFAAPDRFDPTREQLPHLAFSTGPHYCLGAALARVEGQHGLSMLIERFPDIHLARRPPVPHQLMLRGHDELWVRLS